MTKLCFFIALTFCCLFAKAQLVDDFSDGDFTSNPPWAANPADFIVNAARQLQSNNTTANSSFYITTTNSLAVQTEWEFWIKIDFNPSSANYVDVWLAAASQDLTATGNSGYFVRVGSTDDDICLYKKLPSGSAIKMIDGINGILNTSSSTLKIKVIRTAADKWILLRDLTASGTAYKSEGEVTDNSINTSNYFGILIRQSTASFFQKHFFDDISVKSYSGNPSLPKVTEAAATNATTLKLTFNNPVNVASAEDAAHYFVAGIGNPTSAKTDDINGSVVLLTFPANFVPNLKNSIIINGVQDVYGNTLTDAMTDFYYYQAGRYDVVINEVFADPNPQVGLPLQKFLELKNKATFTVNLQNWKLNDGNNTAILPAIDLKPDSFLIITTASGLSAYSSFGKTIAVSGFPSLNISGGQVALYNESSALIHAMTYDLTTYQNELKKEGGYTLEMIDSKMACLVAGNWIASKDASGGTPGRKNSVAGTVNQSEPDYKVLNAYLSTPDTLYLAINKTVDSTLASKKENYVIANGPGIQSVEVLPPFFNLIRIALSAPAAENKIYTVKVNSLTGCDGYTISNVYNNATFGIPVSPNPKDIVINEILFAPRTGGADYVELYNRSQKIIDLKKLYLANRNSTGVLAAFTSLASQSQLLMPGKFALLTTDPLWTRNNYPISDPDVFIKLSSLPSYPDANGNVVLTDTQGNILDEVSYNSSWHFPLIKDKKGIALERISYDGPSDQSNFHSASKDVSYGTPGIKNSQSKTDDISGEFSISPEIFSPDNDGTDDFLTIYYQFPNEGYTTNIKIYDAKGRFVRYLEKNSLSGIKGYYRWDGLDDKQQKLPQGIYIVHMESFHRDGGRKVYKKAVVLARRF